MSMLLLWVAVMAGEVMKSRKKSRVKRTNGRVHPNSEKNEGATTATTMEANEDILVELRCKEPKVEVECQGGSGGTDGAKLSEIILI